MAFYSCDRFNGLGIATSGGATLVSKQELQQVAPVYHQDVGLQATYVPPVILSFVSASTAVANSPPKSAQQQADDELAQMNRDLAIAEQNTVAEQAGDLGPPSSPLLLYAGVGAGALALIGGLLYFTRKKGSKKVSGYRRRRR